MPENADKTSDAEILKKRAETLAKPKSGPEQKETVKTVGFLLAGEIYGIELSFVREVLPLGQLTFLPGLPAYIPGIIHVRGEILSIMDLKRLFELKPSERAENAYVLILSTKDMAFGVLADRIIGVQEIPADLPHTSVPTLTGVRAAYLKGIDASGTIVLDGEKLLIDEALVIDQNDNKYP
ncbi:MAG: chemotaxis protein CheW [Desulfobacterales bacterium]